MDVISRTRSSIIDPTLSHVAGEGSAAASSGMAEMAAGRDTERSGHVDNGTSSKRGGTTHTQGRGSAQPNQSRKT